MPDLLLGSEAQGNSYQLVDDLTAIMGGTATLFSRTGDDFVRISTNVITDTGRATGTLLAPTGAAMAAIRQGKAFYGSVDILGNPFVTGYEPLTNAQGEVVGIGYVGYKADLEALRQLLASSRLLNSGFVALLDRNGAIRAQSSHIKAEADCKNEKSGVDYSDRAVCALGLSDSLGVFQRRTQRRSA